MRTLIASIEGEYRRYKTLAEGALDQLPDSALAADPGTGAHGGRGAPPFARARELPRGSDRLCSQGAARCRLAVLEHSTRSVGALQPGAGARAHATPAPLGRGAGRRSQEAGWCVSR